jgi:hypothetical protein
VVSDKKAQRQRRKSGHEQVSTFVYMPKLIAWLIWRGYLDPGVHELPPKERRAAINDAVGRHLWRCYSRLAEPCPARKPIIVEWPGYASGSLAQDIQDTTPPPLVGMLQRESELAKHYGLSPTFLISRRKLSSHGAIPPLAPHHPGRPGQSSPPHRSEYLDELYAPTYHHAPDWHEEPAPAADDYDPEVDVEEESLDMQEQDVAACFDPEGYET